jgi:REP element-mobilizing transposase RayT
MTLQVRDGARNVQPQRKHTRLSAFDYRSPGPYFVTICTQHREHRFGAIVADEMRSSPAGEMVSTIWTSIFDQFPAVVLDDFVVMPNHVHGILWFEPDEIAVRPSLADVITWFKTVTTNHYIRGVRDSGWPQYDRRLWQRNYHEHIVRNIPDMDRIRAYIRNNPANWRADTYHSS